MISFLRRTPSSVFVFGIYLLLIAFAIVAVNNPM